MHVKPAILKVFNSIYEEWTYVKLHEDKTRWEGKRESSAGSIPSIKKISILTN